MATTGGAGTFTQHVLIGDISRISNLRVVDLDRDGDGDILVSVYGSASIWWLENRGAGSFRTGTVARSFVGVIGCSIDRGTVAWWENDGSEVFSRRVMVAWQNRRR